MSAPMMPNPRIQVATYLPPGEEEVSTRDALCAGVTLLMRIASNAERSELENQSWLIFLDAAFENLTDAIDMFDREYPKPAEPESGF